MKKGTVVALLSLFITSLCHARKNETWIEVRSPNFIVVSNAGDKQARKAALQFEQIRAVFRQSLPVAKDYPTAVLTVLAVKNEDSMRELLPEYWAKGHAHPLGLFVSRAMQFYAAVDLEDHGIHPYEALYHEYFHLLTTPYFPDLPVWITEGLAEFYAQTDIDNKNVIIGQTNAMLLMGLRSEPLIPLNVLLNVDRTSPYYNEQSKTSMFYAESWALTHYLMIGDRGAHRPMFISYLKAVDEKKTQEAAASEAFGDLKKLQSALRKYIDDSQFFVSKIPAPPSVDESTLVTRGLSDAEADAYLGGFAAVRGRTEQAKVLLERAVQLDPNIALAYQYLALISAGEGQHSKAVEAISQAVKLDPKNAFTRYLRAYFATNGGASISNGQQVEEDLRQAIAINPQFAAPYGLLAVYLAISKDKGDLSEAFSLAKNAVVLEPGNATYELDLAEVLARMKRFEDAKIMASHAKLQAQSPQEKARVETFLAYLEHPDSIQLHKAEANNEEVGVLGDLNKARAALRERNYTSAIEILQKLLDSHSQSKEGWNLLGLAYLSSHRNNEAITAFKKQIDLTHDTTSAYNNLGRAYWADHKYEDAEAAFRQQLQVNPSDIGTNTNLGNLYLQWHKYTEAALELQKVASVRPNDAHIQVSLGDAYLDLGQDQKAMATFDAAIKLSPTPAIWNSIAYRLALKNSHLDLAQQYVQSAIKITSAKLAAVNLEQLSMDDLSLVSSITAYWDTLGWIYYTLGNLEEAERYLLPAWNLSQAAAMGDHMGQLYEKRGETEKAIQMYALAIAAYEDPETRQRLTALVGGEEKAMNEINNQRSALPSLRTIQLTAGGPPNTSADFFVLLAPSSPGARGTRVEAVKFIRGDEQLKSIETALKNALYPLTFAEDRLIKIVRRGTVSCSSAGDCSFSMMLPQDVRGTETLSQSQFTENGERIYRVSDGVTAPKAIYSPNPEYTKEARKAKYEGTAVLWAIVGSDGLPRNIKVMRSVSYGLDEKAVEAVRRWKFQPSLKDGKPVAVQISVEIDFRLY